MSYKFNVLILFALLILLAGCVSKIEFDQINSNYTLVQDKLSVTEEKLRRLELQVKALENERLSDKKQLQELNKTVKEQKIIISLQGKVIKLLDDSKQTLQKSIEAQVAAQDIQLDAFPVNQ